MTDLDLGLFPLSGGTPPPRRPSRRWVRSAVTFVVCLALLGVMLRLVATGESKVVDTFSSTRDYHTAGTGTTIVVVADKSSLSAIATSLRKAHVVRTTGAFTKAFGKQTAVTKIAPGYYQLREHMSAASAVALLLDPSAKLRTKVTIPEGTSMDRALALIAAGTNLAPADLSSAAASPVALDLPEWAKPTSLEGFLYPATYQFNPQSNSLAAMQQMVTAFGDEADALKLADSQDKVHHNPYQVLTIASILEKEAGKPADYPRIARVIYNRLAKNMKLQLDSTVDYVLPERKGHLSQADLENPSPYNTYQHVGLPPTPIDSPGALALKAALAPSDGDWTFFVTVDKQGTTLFTNSYTEFLKDKALAKTNGVIP